MRAILRGTARGLADVEGFLAELDNLAAHPEPAARFLFDPAGEIIVTRAPGRLDLMGGIADYSGALVLQWPLREATFVAVQRHSGRSIHIVSLNAEANARAPSFATSLDEIFPSDVPVDYAAARDFFALDPSRRWAAYVVGTMLVLERERGFRFAEGLRILVRSTVPEGKGVSSSAALEVAAMTAVAAAFDLNLDPRDLALLCQKVENLVVGAPCGVMDQMTSASGRAGELLAILCQPAELRGTVPLPPDLAIFGLDSGVRHEVSGFDYTDVRIGAFMGARIIADLAGLQARAGVSGGAVEIEDGRWGGYLANVSPSEFERLFANLLPDAIPGAEFLERYQGTTDCTTWIEPDRTYAVRRPTAHPIYEHFRVRTFAELLAGPVTTKARVLLGELMYQSHASYSACGLGSEGTDLLVELVHRAGPATGFHGAKITGGGSGGTVAVLAEAGADVAPIVEAYAAQAGYQPHVFAGSSPGAAAFGHVRLGPDRRPRSSPTPPSQTRSIR